MKINHGRVGMKLRNRLSIAIMSFFCIAGMQSAAAAAEFEGNIEIGAAQVGIDNPSSKFMEYRGVKGNGAYLLGDVELSYNDKSFYLGLTGKELGLDTRDILLESGKYGRYRFFIEYDQIPHFISNNSKTIFDGAGTANLTLPSGYDRTSAYPKTLVDQIINGTKGLGGYGNLKDIDLKLERKTTSAGFSMTSFKGVVDFNLEYKRIKQDGIKSIGTTIQSSAGSGGNPRDTVILPEPVDYATDELKASVAYNRNKAQLEFEYYISSFNNETESLTWQNPFYYGAANPVISLPPDNKYQRLSLSGGVSLPMTTRVNMTAEYGKMTQDQNFLPYNAANPTTSNLPRTSLDAAIETKLVNVNVSSRPISMLDINARYRHYDTVNLTPEALYLYSVADGQNSVTIKTSGTASAVGVYGDGTPTVVGVSPCSVTNPCYSGFGSAIAQGTINSAQARYNELYAYSQDQGKLDASYLIAKDTTLSLGYDKDIITRSHRETATTVEDVYRAKIASNASFASLGGNYLKGMRRSGNYDGSATLESHTAQYIAVLETPGVNYRTWVNLPELRKYDVADRDREKYGAFISIFPADVATVGFNYSHGRDEFTETLIGLKDTLNDTYTVDVSVSPSETLSMYVYYTNDSLESNQAGRAISGANIVGTNTDAYNWFVNNNDKTDTVGAGLTFQFLKGKLTINPDYTYSKSNTKIGINVADPTKVTVSPLPDLESERNTLNVTAKYKLTDNLTLGAGYIYENYRSSDWATDGVTLSNISTLPSGMNLIPLSGSVPDYTANVGTVTVAYKW